MSWCICICIYIYIILYTCISNDIYVVSVFVQGDVFCAFCVPFQVDGQLLEKAKLDGGSCIMRNPSPTVVTVVYKKCVLISVLQDSRLLPYSQVRISVKSNFEIKFAKRLLLQGSRLFLKLWELWKPHESCFMMFERCFMKQRVA